MADRYSKLRDTVYKREGGDSSEDIGGFAPGANQAEVIANKAVDRQKSIDKRRKAKIAKAKKAKKMKAEPDGLAGTKMYKKGM